VISFTRVQLFIGQESRRGCPPRAVVLPQNNEVEGGAMCFKEKWESEARALSTSLLKQVFQDEWADI
jgi:hypothetical protein